MLRYIIVFLVAFVSNAQNIKGTVTCNNVAVPFASIILKDETSKTISYSFTDENGQYLLDFKKSDTQFLIFEIQSLSHEPLVSKISFLDLKNNLFVYNFKLSERITPLKEVLIEVKQKPIKQKKDTTTYNISQFLDGSERKVQDILKKLPGIKVDAKGEIEFKGKKIKKMLLDGDDLFDSQYTIGTKNINADMIDNVQAIEHFNENKLLHGLNDSQDVALNLKLKKLKSDYSGEIALGYAYVDRTTLDGVLLRVSSNWKSFATMSYNNVGNNFSPYDFQSNIKSLQAINESEYKAKELIEQGAFSSAIEDKYHRINNNFYSSINTVGSLGKKTKLKVNADFYNDKLSRQNVSESAYTINNEKLYIKTIEDIVKTPQLYNLGCQLNHYLSDSLSIEYIGRVEYQKSKMINSSSNNDILQTSEIYSENLFTKQTINFCKRINKNSAFLSSLFYSKDMLPQELMISPGSNFLSNSQIDNNIENIQSSFFKKEYINFTSEYFKKVNKILWNCILKYNYVNNDFNSKLAQSTNSIAINLPDFEYSNNLKYYVSIPSVLNKFSYITKKYEFRVGLLSQYYNFRSKDYTRSNELEGTEFIITPNLSFLLNTSRKSTLIIDYSLNQIPPNESNFYTGYVLTNYRSLINNEPNFKLLKKNSISLNYLFQDFFSLSKISFRSNYNINNNAFFAKNYIDNQFNKTTSFMLESGSSDFSINLGIEKYLDILKSTVQLDTNFYQGNGKNIVNNSELRNIENKIISLDFKLIPGIISKVFYMDNKSSFSKSASFFDSNLVNQFSSFKNSSKVIINVKDKFRWVTTLNILYQDLSQNNNFKFLDSELNFSSKNKKISYSIVGRNLGDISTFNTISISDFSTYSFSHNLIPRYILFSISFSF